MNNMKYIKIANQLTQSDEGSHVSNINDVIQYNIIQFDKIKHNNLLLNDQAF